MSALVLIVGALMVAAGGYEMYAGNGDILSERGWSAFIAGAVLLAGGIVTAALGFVVRALDGLRGVMTRPVGGFKEIPARERVEPDPEPERLEHEPTHGPSLEEAPTAPALAEAPFEPVLFEPQAAPAETAPFPVERQYPEASVEVEPVAVAEVPHDDWLDHSFAELEREMAAPPPAEKDLHSEPAKQEPVEAAFVTHAVPVTDEPARDHVSPTTAALREEPSASEPFAPHSEPTTRETVPDGATVSARERSSPPNSAVIGRYESEGTSYVMYADGSIDAQSEAGVYRFASMSELKAFIES